MKIGMIADVHLNTIDALGPIDAKSGFSVRTLDRLSTIENAIIKSINRGCQAFVILGDLYDKLNPTERLKEALNSILVKHANSIKIFIIVGNHDGAGFTHNYLNDKVFLDLFSNQTNGKPIRIVDELEFLTDEKVTIAMIPWIEDTELLKEKLALVPKNSIVLSHLEIDGALSSSEIALGLGTPASLFSRFKRVFLGHYHKRQKIKNIMYIGSSNIKDFSELGEPKGFIIYDTDTDTDTFYQLEPRSAYQFNIDLENIEEFIKVLENNEIKSNSLIKLVVTGEKNWVHDVVIAARGEIRALTPLKLKIEKNFLRADIVDNSEFKEVKKLTSRIEKIKALAEKVSIESSPLIEIYQNNFNIVNRGV